LMRSGPALLVLCALASVAAARRSAAHTPLAFTHVTLIDATGAPKTQDMTVVVVGSRIRDVGPTAHIAVPKDARVVDASGKYLIPGLLDMHVHLFSNASRPATNLKE
jgi:imidazolonepropionase-like amidohydrolase